ncbi:MAG TPA: class I SAM-dependent methyltransferase [Kofleriaceae bacterium]
MRGFDLAGTVALIALGVACSSPQPPAPSGTYAGRPIAQTMSYLGADWLDRPDRDTREQPERVLDSLKLAPTMTVADIGAGTGYFTLRLATRVANVIATDLQPQMLEILRSNLHGRTNIRLILASDHDAALPPACCDVVLMVDVYHELADPPAILHGVANALTPTGRLVLVEYRGEDPQLAIKPEHKMTLAQLKLELAQLHFKFVESNEMLPDQRIVTFVRD